MIRDDTEFISPRSIERLFGLRTKTQPDRKAITLQHRAANPHNEARTPIRKVANGDSLPEIDQQQLLKYASKFKGVDYEFGAEYPDNGQFDCSSFTRYVYRHFDVDLPRVARDQAKEGVRVSQEELRPGDLLFFSVPGRFKNNHIPGHVGIYWGDGKMIHTLEEGVGVTVESLNKEKFRNNYLTARRVAQ
ncbi:hypothetical protein CHM34_01210 [Paludifilum halophilum]|uniref:NlpC/P60 domain-containing protein n=2 Tax=Paludifilum halophilum TaxID=1642702 RepID=A0A235BCE9_9BACL|nr:hypothetical protein CHM34_01210 [Paludifilum halophilum]